MNRLSNTFRKDPNWGRINRSMKSEPNFLQNRLYLPHTARPACGWTLDAFQTGKRSVSTRAPLNPGRSCRQRLKGSEQRLQRRPQAAPGRPAGDLPLVSAPSTSGRSKVRAQSQSAVRAKREEPDGGFRAAPRPRPGGPLSLRESGPSESGLNVNGSEGPAPLPTGAGPRAFRPDGFRPRPSPASQRRGPATARLTCRRRRRPAAAHRARCDRPLHPGCSRPEESEAVPQSTTGSRKTPPRARQR